MSNHSGESRASDPTSPDGAQAPSPDSAADHPGAGKRFCGDCGAALAAGGNFCGSCGAARHNEPIPSPFPPQQEPIPTPYEPVPSATRQPAPPITGGWHTIQGLVPQVFNTRPRAQNVIFAIMGVVVVLTIIEVIFAATQPGGLIPPSTPRVGGSDNRYSTYSGSDLAAALKQSIVNSGYRADRVTVSCQDARRQAGAISDCQTTMNSIAGLIRVTYSDTNDHFTLQKIY